MDSLLNVREVAEYLGVSPSTVYRYKDNKRLPFYKDDSSLRSRLWFKQEEVDEWFSRYKRKTFHVDKILNNALTNSYALVIDKAEGGQGTMTRKVKKRCLYFVINGEIRHGSIYPRKDKDGWKWAVNFIGPKRKRIRRKTKTQSEEKAGVFLKEEMEKAFGNECSSEKENIKFEEFGELYLEKYAKTNKKSWKTDRYYLKSMNNFFSDYCMKELTSENVEEFKREKLSQGVTKSTVNRYLATLRKMVNLAKEWGYLPNDKKIKFKLFSEKDNCKERILTEEEEVRLLEKSYGNLKSILIIALNTGMRLGEILNLKWNQIDFSTKRIKAENTKSGKSRDIPVNALLFSELQKLKRVNGQNAYVFFNPETGKPFTNIKRAFHTACKNAKIKGLRFHDLRHTFATRLVEKGVDLITVKELLGHSTVKITERYTHPSQEVKKKALDLLVESLPEKDRIHRIMSPKGHQKKRESQEADFSPFFSVN